MGPRPSRILGALVASATLLLGGAARADVFDWSLPRLVLKPDGTAGEVYANPASPRNQAAGVLSAYRTVVSEMATALAPKILSPSDTIGYSGFQFDLDYSFTTINANRCAEGDTQRDNCPWQHAVEGGRDGSGNRTMPPGMIHTLSVMARKGIWLPLPSFEVGAGATKMLQSDLYAVQVYAKFAIHEGYHRFPLPSFAVRGSGMRVMGSRQVDLTMGQIDASISKSFGVAGTVTMVPYVGFAALFIVARGQVLDLSPECDAFTGRGCPATTPGGPGSLDLNNNAVFPSQETIVRWRVFGGLRLNYNILVLTADYVLTPCGDLTGGTCGNRHAAVADRAGHQHTFSGSVGFLF